MCTGGNSAAGGTCSQKKHTDIDFEQIFDVRWELIMELQIPKEAKSDRGRKLKLVQKQHLLDSCLSPTLSPQ